MTKLQLRIKALEDALRPFAHAAKRCLCYGNPRDGDTQLVAVRPEDHSHEWELLASGDPDDGKDVPLQLEHLLNAYEAMKGEKA